MSAAWKKVALEQAKVDAIEIEDDGHTVQMFTDYHWRIDGIDVWPSSKKFMKGGVVRKYKRLQNILKTNYVSK